MDGEALINNRSFLGSMIRTIAETPRSGLDGIMQEHQFYKDYTTWGFLLDDVSDKTRTLIINGSVDIQVPMSHARWYNNRIKNSKMLQIEGHGHVSWWINQPNYLLKCAQCVMDNERYVNPPVWEELAMV